MNLHLRNPHSILAALQARPQDVLQISLPPQNHRTDPWAQIGQVAKEKKIPLGFAKSKPSSHEPGREGGGEALIKEREGVPSEILFTKNKKPGLWLALDCLKDPHNIGAIFRTAAFFNVCGILLTQERSAPLSATVYDVASGGMEYVPFTLQINLQRAFEVAKKSGLWILGTSEHANDSLASVQPDRPWLLVLGSEESGMRRLTEENCDVLCKIQNQSPIRSLNVSVAAGICMAHLSGQPS